MGHYQESNSLSTGTEAPMSGPGSSTPEQPAGNADYSTWSWEVMLATVLGIAIPDRTEVTGQPWLTITHDGQAAGGMHLIWSAGWNTSPNSGSASIAVYLNPALYTAGGAWDRFLNAPSGLSGVPSRDYTGLLMVPPTFESASVAVTSVTAWMASAAQEFGSLHHDAASGSIARFQGNLAGVVTELLGSLRTVMLTMHEQMTNPAPYGESLSAAGTSAAAFLSDVWSAYTSWTQLIEHSPLGAVVQVLEQIATRDGSGAYVIADPQATPYGDLTVDASWAQVEQQAKNQWLGALAGGSAGFSGLDLLGRTALSKLVGQFATTTSAIAPVIGPAPPPPVTKPVNPGSGSRFSGPGSQSGPTMLLRPNGLSGPNGPNGLNSLNGPNNPGFVTSNDFSVKTPVTGLAAPGQSQIGALSFAQATGGKLAGGGQRGAGLPGSGSPGPVPVFGLLGPIGASVEAGRTGAIGQAGEAGGVAMGPGGDVGFTGTIGRPSAARDPAGRRKKSRKAPAVVLTAPAAGASLGRDPSGPVLGLSAVPGMAARPPAVMSGPVNLQLVPGTGGTPGQVAAPPGGPGGTAMAGDSALTVAGEGGVLGPGVLGPGGIGAGGPGGPMAMLPGGTGTGGAAGQSSRERHRLAYLPEEPEFWQTEPDRTGGSIGIGSRDEDADDDDEPDFSAGRRRVTGIGATQDSGTAKDKIEERRTR